MQGPTQRFEIQHTRAMSLYTRPGQGAIKSSSKSDHSFKTLTKLVDRKTLA